MNESLFGRVDDGIPVIVFWTGTINEGGTSDDYTEIVHPVEKVEELIRVLRGER